MANYGDVLSALDAFRADLYEQTTDEIDTLLGPQSAAMSFSAPSELLTLSRELAAEGTSTGLTTTDAGAWALFVRVSSIYAAHKSEIEHRAAGFPVLYEHIDTMPVARPAFPAKGD